METLLALIVELLSVVAPNVLTKAIILQQEHILLTWITFNPSMDK